MSTRPGPLRRRLTRGALLLLVLLSLCPPVASATPVPEAILPPDRAAAMPGSSLRSPSLVSWGGAGRKPVVLRGEPAPPAAVAADCVNPVLNGGFESGNFMYWGTSGAPTVLGTGGYSGSNCAQLGGRDNAVDAVYQTMSCPFDSQGLVGTAFVYIAHDGPLTSADCLTARLTTSTGQWAQQQVCSHTGPLDTWQSLSFEFGLVQKCPPGGTYQWSFTAQTDGTGPSWFLVDDVSITACPFCAGDGVCLCEDTDYGGECRVWTSDDYELGDDGWHDRASSIKFVGSYAGGRYKATLHEHAYYSGASTTFFGDDPWLGDDAIGNDSADSIDIEIVPTPSTPTPTRTRTPTPTATGQPSATPTRTGVGTMTRTVTPWPTLTGGVKRLHLPLLLRHHWTPRPQDCTELLANGGFESGGLSGWSRWGDVTTGAGRNSPTGAQMGGVNSAQGELWQFFFVPANAESVTWRFWWKAATSVTQPEDFLRVYTGVGDINLQHGLLRAQGTLDQWQMVEVDLTQWAGQWVMAALQVEADGATPTTFRVDDASVLSCVRP